MSENIYRYTVFEKDIYDEVIETLHLSRIAIESLYGKSRVGLDLRFVQSSEKGTIAVDAGTEIGRDFNAVFLGFLDREFGMVGRIGVERLPRRSEHFTESLCSAIRT